jgi:hypothetical protein
VAAIEPGELRAARKGFRDVLLRWTILGNGFRP